MSELSIYLNGLMPGIYMIIKWIVIFIIGIIFFKFVKSKIPGRKKNYRNWGLTKDEIEYIYDGQTQEMQ